MPVSRLQHLHGDEVSLVPKAANRRRFLLRKGDHPMAFDEVKALQLIEKLDAAGQGELIEALGGADDPAAVAMVAKATSCSESEQTKLKAALRMMGPALAKKFPNLAKALDPAADAEDAADGGDDEDTEKKKTKAQKKAEADAIAKAAAAKPVELPAEVQAQLKKADETAVELRKAQDRITKMEDDKAREAFIRKAADLAGALPGATADDLGGILFKTAKALTKDEQAKLEGVLKGANALVKSAAFAELGSSIPGAEGDAYQQLVAKADVLRKADPKLTPERARAQVLKADPTLMAAINRAQDERLRKARS